MDSYDAGDEDNVKQAEQKQRHQRNRKRDGLARTLRSKDGREWLWSVLSKGGMYSSLSCPDPAQMAILSGRRDLALEILIDITAADPDAYMKMQKESNNGDYDER